MSTCFRQQKAPHHVILLGKLVALGVRSAAWPLALEILDEEHAPPLVEKFDDRDHAVLFISVGRPAVLSRLGGDGLQFFDGPSKTFPEFWVSVHWQWVVDWCSWGNTWAAGSAH